MVNRYDKLFHVKQAPGFVTINSDHSIYCNKIKDQEGHHISHKLASTQKSKHNIIRRKKGEKKSNATIT